MKRRAIAFRGQITQLSPLAADEMRGLALGAGVDPLDILALNVRTELLPAEFGEPLFREGRLNRAQALARNALLGHRHPDDRVDPRAGQGFSGEGVNECTAFAVAQNVSADGHTWLCQNWDWVGWQRSAVVLRRSSEFGSLTEAGMLAKIGVNAHGFAVGLNILRSTEDGVGAA